MLDVRCLSGSGLLLLLEVLLLLAVLSLFGGALNNTVFTMVCQKDLFAGRVALLELYVSLSSSCWLFFPFFHQKDEVVHCPLGSKVFSNARWKWNDPAKNEKSGETLKLKM
jgi:hypothetical protein